MTFLVSPSKKSVYIGLANVPWAVAISALADELIAKIDDLLDAGSPPERPTRPPAKEPEDWPEGAIAKITA